MFAAAAIAAAAAVAGAAMSASSAGSAKNPYGKAAPWLAHLPELYAQAENPYREVGLHDLGMLQGIYSHLAANPTKALQNIAGSPEEYENSPAFIFQKQQAMDAANQAAAAGGMVGSPAEQAQLAKYITGDAFQHYQQNLRNKLGLYDRGLAGLSGISKQGYDATQNYVHGLANYLNSRAHLGAASTQWENERRARIAGDIGSGIQAAGTLGSAYAGSRGEE